MTCPTRQRHSAAGFLFLLSLLLGNAGVSQGAEGSLEQISLPAAQTWEREVADVTQRDGILEVVAPLNYKIGRVASPVTAAQAGDGFTLAAEIRTRFVSNQGGFYRFWLQIECLRDDQVIATVHSPEIVGTQETEQLLAVTAFAPAETTGVRAVLCVQNKFWSLIENQALIGNLRLLKLSGGPGRTLHLESLQELPKRAGDRAARFVVHGDWPNATAVAISSSRGTISPAALLSNGRAEIELHYTDEEVGRAELMARVTAQETRLQVTDPRAATLSITGVTADGEETPVVVQLTHQGDMLPGRYQAAVQGIFVTPPWSIDLAPGEWQLRISRGPQFQSFEREFQCSSGERIELGAVTLSRNDDLLERGWYGGDGDGDVYHGEVIYQDVNAETAADIAQAMGLDWLGVGSWSSGQFGGPRPKTWGEARKFMRSQSHSRFLMMWTDERPKSEEGHACFIGLERPDTDPFGWGWTGGARRPLRNFEMLQVVRASGGATFANHPLRWWMKGTRFNTNMYSSLPFDLCAAGLLDGVNINDKPEGIQLWSMLLDHGYRVAATAGADFCLDRPNGPPPGLHRMYCYCPDGLRPDSLAKAVRQGHTIVSTGPVLIADLDGQPPGSTVATDRTHTIRVQAWARGDHADAPLRRLELWAHGKVIETKELAENAQRGEVTFRWQPKGAWDWVAVRAVARGGWAMTSAFYAASPDFQPPGPIDCKLTLQVRGLSDAQRSKATVEIWDGVLGLTTSEKRSEFPLHDQSSFEVPVSATILVRLADGRQREVSIYDVIGMPKWVEQIASGARREQPLLEWKNYADVIQRAARATAVVEF